MATLTETFQAGLTANTNGFSHKYICLTEKDNREVCITYEQLYQKAVCFLNYFQMRGIGPGEELIIMMEDNEPFLYIFWACILGGIIPVPISASNNREHRLKLHNIWRILRKPNLVTPKKLFNSLEELEYGNIIDSDSLFQSMKDRTIFLEDIHVSTPGMIYPSKPGDIALIQFSSGSTGAPKGVVLTHKNLMTNIAAIIKCAQLRPDDRTLSWMPLTHDMGLIGFHLVPLIDGKNQFLIHTSLFIRRPLQWMDKVYEYQATILSSPNFGFQYFLSFLKPDTTRKWDLSRVRLIFNGAEPISGELCHKFLSEMEKYQLGKNVIFPVYGMAEASLAVTFPPPGEAFITCNLNRDHLGIRDKVKDLNDNDLSVVTFVDVGFPVDKCLMRICDERANILEDNTIGYIQIKGENVTPGYYNNPEANQEAFFEEGWLDTGDLGFIRKGRLIVTGRAKDIIFINGRNYYAHDIERVAQEIEEVEPGTVAACGIIDENEQREEIMLFVLYKKPLEKFAQIAVNIKKHIFKTMGLEIKNVIPVNKIPKTTSGKVMRFRLKEKYLNGEFATVIQELNFFLAQSDAVKNIDLPETSIEERLVEIWTEILGNKISVNDNFLEISGDSLFLVSFCAKIEQEKLGKVSLIDLFSYPSIKKLAAFLECKETKYPEQINFLQIKMPGEYLNSERNDLVILKTDPVYSFKIQKPLCDEIQKICQIEKVEVDDILLALFGYLLYEISAQDEITLQTMTGKMNQAEMLAINFNEINEISALFQLVQLKRNANNNQTYPLQSLHHIATARSDKSFIVPFFYNERNLTIEIDLLSIYDICLGVIRTENSINLTFDYNNKLLKPEKMKEFLRLYAGLIYSSIDKYQGKGE